MITLRAFELGALLRRTPSPRPVDRPKYVDRPKHHVEAEFRLPGRPSRPPFAGIDPMSTRARTDVTVLLVDDHDQIRLLVGLLLEDWGYEVLVASSGDEALTACDRHAGPIDLLVTDVSMPGMTGRELADLVRVRRRGLRVLYTSGYPQETCSNARHDEPEVY